MFRNKLFVIIVVLALLAVDKVQAVDVDFYSDGVIEDGDVYNIVRVFDTPPDNTTIDMFGGSVASLRTYDSSTANIYGGEVLAEIRTANSSTVNIRGGSVTCDFLAVGGNSTLNICGGDLLVGNSPGFSYSSTVNIYGYGFEYEAGSLTGFLADGSGFIFMELFSDDYSHMNLIVVPEPLDVTIEATPHTLNLNSGGKWLTCHIWLPEDYNATGINTDSVLLEGRVKADSISFNEQQQISTARFNRADVTDILEPGEVEIRVTGHLVNGTYFEGVDTIKVIDKKPQK